MNMKIDMMPPVSKENKQEYAKVQDMLNDPKKLQSFQSYLLEMLKSQMGKDAVITFDNKLVANVQKRSTMIAINENNSGWKFVEPIPQIIEQLKKVLPQEIVANEKEIFVSN